MPVWSTTHNPVSVYINITVVIGKIDKQIDIEGLVLNE